MEKDYFQKEILKMVYWMVIIQIDLCRLRSKMSF